MKKFFIALFTVLFFISLVGCQSKEEKPLNFSGKGDYWTADVVVTPGKDKKENKKINLTYTGDDLNSINEFEFKLTGSNGQWGMGAIKLDKEGKFEGESSTRISEKTVESDQLVLTVTWNNQSEKIDLNSK
ncbi:hypothetical protein WKH56_34630 [Priestia sp. SB1]|uniref:hypothetical protein n=1 Tax=Priestia sp. SB1 TaxID=3132359 RepID=UPI00316C6F25